VFAKTLFVPVHEPGAVILLDVETDQPLEIEAAFVGDLHWNGRRGRRHIEDWDESHHAIIFGEETKKFAALVGLSRRQNILILPTTQTNSSSNETSFRLGVTQRGKERKMLVIAASVAGYDDCPETYEHLALRTPICCAIHSALLSQLSCPHREPCIARPCPAAGLRLGPHQRDSGTCDQPLSGHGTGLPGTGTRAASQRPGFAWFFGRDSFWTSFALNRSGGLCDDPNGNRVHRQVPARRRQDSTRDCARRQFRSLVQRFSLSLRFGGRDAAVHHCDE